MAVLGLKIHVRENADVIRKFYSTANQTIMQCLSGSQFISNETLSIVIGLVLSLK